MRNQQDKETEMKIAILGAGEMGALFGAYLSQKNKVWMVDIDADRVQQLIGLGIQVCERDGSEAVY